MARWLLTATLRNFIREYTTDRTGPWTGPEAVADAFKVNRLDADTQRQPLGGFMTPGS